MFPRIVFIKTTSHQPSKGGRRNNPPPLPSKPGHSFFFKKNPSQVQQNKQPPSPSPLPPHPYTQTSSAQTPATQRAHTAASPRNLSPAQTAPPATPASLPHRSRSAKASLRLPGRGRQGRRTAARARRRRRWVRKTMVGRRRVGSARA